MTFLKLGLFVYCIFLSYLSSRLVKNTSVFRAVCPGKCGYSQKVLANINPRIRYKYCYVFSMDRPNIAYVKNVRLLQCRPSKY